MDKYYFGCIVGVIIEYLYTEMIDTRGIVLGWYILAATCIVILGRIIVILVEKGRAK